MFRLRVIQAEFGDSLVLEYGSAAAPRYLLIDGGPDQIYPLHLKPELDALAAAGGRLDLVVLSHVDEDHIVGLLDLFAELREQRANNGPETIAVDGVWFNQFSNTIDPDGDIAPRFRALVSAMHSHGQPLVNSDMSLDSIGQGHQLHVLAQTLGLAVNQSFAGGVIKTDTAPGPIVLDNLALRVVGPTDANLAKLQAEWEDWIDAHDPAVVSGDPFLAGMTDRSIPNLSSVMLHAQADGKTMLLTGDGRGDHLLDGLKETGLGDSDGAIHVDLLKMPHHGSARNATRKFFTQVTADTYVISANGKHDNPDLATLIWLVEAAEEQGRVIDIFVTNETESTASLLANYPPDDYGYTLTAMSRDRDAMILELAP
jgi:hypothetical protein